MSSGQKHFFSHLQFRSERMGGRQINLKLFSDFLHVSNTLGLPKVR